jgi:hypothetical protein
MECVPSGHPASSSTNTCVAIYFRDVGIEVFQSDDFIEEPIIISISLPLNL